jgi:hypothetical protein
VASPFKPKTAPGLKGWIAGTGYYREHLTLEGWSYLDPRNVPLSINKATGISVSATSGSWSTGLDLGDVHPTTKNPKGAATVQKVLQNAAQLDLWTVLGSKATKSVKREQAPNKDRALTWLILVLVDAKTETVRAEVSLPARITGGKVTHWVERILVDVTPPGSDEPKRHDSANDSDDSDVDVPVRRRA